MSPRSLPLHGELPAPAERPSLALAAKGFRPFFLLAGMFAIAIVPLWLLILTGFIAPSTYLDGVTWHAHEMIFGFAVAVIAGFLLTAVGNWTQRETVTGAPLLALAALWVLGRVAMVAASVLPRGLPAVVDLAFLPLLAVVLARPLVATKNRRNLVMIGILGALAAANVVVHLDGLGILAAGSARRACLVAIDVVVLVMVIMAGRVFPMFTRNATGAASVRSLPALDALTIVGMIALTLLDVAIPESRATGAAAGIVAVLAAARAVHWGTRQAARHPLVWILHVGYAWIPIGLALRAAARFDASIPSSLATHALTVGAIGSLTLGMMARVSLGHTGRPLGASKPIVAAFVAIMLAAAVRVVGPLFGTAAYLPSLVAAGTFWALAFLAFVVVYLPVLSRRRTDGKPG